MNSEKHFLLSPSLIPTQEKEEKQNISTKSNAETQTGISSL